MYDIVDLTDAECAPAAALLAARHAAERRRFPLLPVAWEDPARAVDLVRATTSRCDSAAAFDDHGDLVGFLAAFESVPDPASPMARYLPERASLYPVHGHAVASGTDPAVVYRALFTLLAERALVRRVTDHVAHVPIGDPGAELAWFAMEFGRRSIVAVRSLEPVGRPMPSDVVVRVATPDDLDDVDRLVDEEAVFHAASPTFVPYRRAATMDAVRAELADGLASDDHAFLVARRDGRDIGLISVGPGIGSPLYVPDGAAYIAATAVLPDARGSGAGAALVDAAFEWARDRGYRAACLHFHTANAVSSRFWPGIGFVPVMSHVRRRFDERILTSRPAGG